MCSIKKGNNLGEGGIFQLTLWILTRDERVAGAEEWQNTREEELLSRHQFSPVPAPERMAAARREPTSQFQPGTRATFDGVVPKVMLATTRLSEALKHTKIYQRLMDHDAPDSRAAAKRNRKAFEHLNKAVDAGSSIAAMNAAELCYNGSVCGIERDLPRAVHYYATIFERPVNALEELGEHL